MAYDFSDPDICFQPCATAWDCELYPQPEEPYDLGLDEEDDEGDWQVLVLDRFGDKLVSPRLFLREKRAEPELARSW